ncbi:PaaI family thioesterase [Hoyosella altamirensis]|uniref:Thioesterase domain-containing protein n=1 Tax=Hoyosella altamirensis TaxID=616997 RepID=A0A839RNF5_9ACTN|nr:YiiD C-terminal domain-containing protein [Hoyosella altamirensis]MBB3037533.1 thioesterase domain-containing protein [Hoyosella altamirensis]
MSDEPPYLMMANAGIEHMLPPAHRMGVRIVELEKGRVVGEVPVDGNTNHIGTIYAGVLFTVAEVLGGAICLPTFDSANFYPIVKDVRIRFRRPATTTIRATTVLPTDIVETVAEAAEANGKADFELDAELTDTSGQVVATTHGIYQLRKHGT